MAKKKKGTKKPKETGTWYRTLIEGRSKAEFYRHFIKKIKDITTEYFGSDEATRLLKALDTGKIQIPAIETFLFDSEDISDPSLKLYNECKTVEEFVTKSIIRLKRRAEAGETDIIVRDFFLAMADIMATNELYTNIKIKEIFESFLTSLITVRDKSPYTLVIIEPRWVEKIGEQLGLNTEKYKRTFVTFLEAFQQVIDTTEGIRSFLPFVKIVYPVYHDVRENQLSYLIQHFRCLDRPTVVRNALKDIPDLSVDTPQLRSALEYLRSHMNLPFIEIEAAIIQLQELGNSTYLKRYPVKNSLVKVFNPNLMPRNYYNKFNISPLFAYRDIYEQCFTPYFCDVHIDCSKINKKNIESYIDMAKVINLVKGYYNKNKRDINTLTFKITLLNVTEVNKEFVDFINNKLTRIQSSTNKHFIIDVFFDADIVNQRIPEDTITHFRVISDIHTDYNADHNYLFNFGNDFVLNCGDTAGNSVAAGHWIYNYMKKGVVVIGNHLGYSSAHPEKNGIQNMEKYNNVIHPCNTKNNQLFELQSLTNKNDVVLLSNDYIEFQGIIIIGTCLYTDFKLYGDTHREECMAYAKKHMNDFRLPMVMDIKQYELRENGYWYGTTKKFSEGKVVPFTPNQHAFYFHYSFESIKKMVEEHKNKPIIIVTHHAPSPYSIDEKYAGDLLNAAFASNLNKFIVEHPQIRLWSFGHVHTPCDFILGETRLVCCPFGYNNENNFNLPYEYGLRIPIADIKSTKSWRKILAKEIFKGKVQCYDY